MRFWIIVTLIALGYPLTNIGVESPSASAQETESLETPPQETAAQETPSEKTPSQETASAAEGGTADKHASAEQIAAWITDLNSDQYVVRERATLQLRSAGRVAFDSLLTTANAGRPEAADRAVWLLQQAGIEEDHPDQLAALERLLKIKGRPGVVQQAETLIADARQRRSLARFAELGGKFIPAGFDPRLQQNVQENRVIVDDTWQGGDAGMAHVAAIRQVRIVQIFHAPITHEGVRQLRAMPDLRAIHLYGLELSEQQQAALATDLAGIEIDYRRGAFLGVVGDQQLPAAVVRQVRAGTAADAAGIRAGDIIREFDGAAVENFQHLTKLIGKLKGGDRAELKISRGKENLTVQVKFGSWQY